MSRTERKDRFVEKNGAPIFEKEWRVAADKKKWYKPSKKDKKWLDKSRTDKDSVLKKAMLNPDEDGNVILPPKKNTDTWNYN